MRDRLGFIYTGTQFRWRKNARIITDTIIKTLYLKKEIIRHPLVDRCSCLLLSFSLALKSKGNSLSFHRSFCLVFFMEKSNTRSGYKNYKIYKNMSSYLIDRYLFFTFKHPYNIMSFTSKFESRQRVKVFYKFRKK